MKKNPNSQSGIFNPRVLLAFTLCSVGVFLAALGFAAVPPTSAGWSLITSPSINATSNNLDDVTCASASDCWAVGSYLNSQSAYPQTLIEHWNGIAWSIVSSPNTSPTQTNGLDEVACASASDCWAVGNYTYYYNSFPFATPYSQTLIEHWNGTTWTIVESPNTSPTENNSLSGVACASASDCWAVGSTIQHWNGTSWSILASPSGGFLNSVTCLSGSDCWAVGSVLIEHWDGGSWAVVPGAGGSSLLGGTCSSASDCWAVGGNGGESLIEHWDGTSWAVVASPGTEGSLSDVTCATPSEGWATGESDEAGDTGNTFTLVGDWNGSPRAIVRSPRP